jgi:anti-sigma B factor antagonist
VTDRERRLTVAQQPRPGGALVLSVAGELDHFTAPRLRAALEEVPFGPGAEVIIDLSGLEYCDSTGLTVLVTAYHKADGSGSGLALAGLRPELVRVFDIVGLDQLFTVHPTVGDALERPR